MATADEKSMKQHPRRQNNQEETKRMYRSIFELPTEFFDSCRLLPSPSHALSDRDVSKNDAVEESPAQEDIMEHLSSLNDAKTMQRWSCNTCKAEFESLQDQRLHFKSDLHRFNMRRLFLFNFCFIFYLLLCNYGLPIACGKRGGCKKSLSRWTRNVPFDSQ